MANIVPRISVTVSPEILEAITSYQYDTRQENRSEAAVKLMMYGLEALQRREQPARDSGLSGEDIRIAKAMKNLRPDYRRLLLAQLEAMIIEAKTNTDSQG